LIYSTVLSLVLGPVLYALVRRSARGVNPLPAGER
jgi:hypothetical protein